MKTWAVIGFFCCVLAGVFWVYPVYEEVEGLKMRSAALEKKILQKQNEKKVLLSDGASSSLGALQKRITYDVDQEGLIRDILKITQLAGFSFSGLNFSLSDNPDLELGQVTINLTVYGRRDRIPDLLKLIEKNSRFMGMDNLGISSGKKGDGMTQFSLSLYAFFSDVSF